MKLWSEIAKLASVPLEAGDIEQINGNDYIKGHVAIQHANEVFGLGNWYSRAIGEPEVRESSNKFLVSQRVQVTVFGICDNTGAPRSVSFVDRGCCPVPKDVVQGWDTAEKGAVTDGMKRALRNFGNQFGLGLYWGSAGQPGPARLPKKDARPVFKALQDSINAVQSIEELISVWKEAKPDIDTLPEDWEAHIMECFTNKKGTFAL